MVAAVDRPRNILGKSAILTLTFAVSTFFVFGCGGGGERQDTGEKSATWNVAVEEWYFPATQRLGKKYRMRLIVRNLSDTTIPNLTVSFTGLDDLTNQPGAADPVRPRWVRDRPKPGSQTAGRDTYAYGPVEPGRTSEFWMDLTPVRRGRQLVTYTLAGGLGTESKITYDDGSPATGQREIAIDPSVDIEKDTLD